MNSYERFFCTLNRKKTDRVPIVEWDIHPKVMKAICPRLRKLGKLERCKILDEFVEEMGLDAVVAEEVHVYKKIDESTIIDDWGVTKKDTGQTACYPIGAPIRCKKDINRFNPPDPTADYKLEGLRYLVKKYKGRKPIVFILEGELLTAEALRGTQQLLEDFILNPGLAHSIIEISSEYHTQLAKAAIDAGAEVILGDDDYAGNAGPFISPQLFIEFILPTFKKLVKLVKERGTYFIKHTDGNIWSLMDVLVGSGIDAINPLQPSAGMSLEDVKKEYGDKLILVGNIDCGELLSRGSIDEVERAVKECILKAGIGGGGTWYLPATVSTLL